MGAAPYDIVILGLSITSSWGNGHATTYRSLMRQLVARGHSVLFLERDVPWYAENRDLPSPPYGETELYASLADLHTRFAAQLRAADCVIVGSYVPEGVAVANWVLDQAGGAVAFYDIDTPVTLARLAQGNCEYLAPDLIPRFDLYLSFTGGPLLRRIERDFGAQCARALYCSVDPELYRPAPQPLQWDLGYLGTYSTDRQPTLERLLCAPARGWPDGRFVVAGPLYPAELAWPANATRIEHLPPLEHCGFYNAQRFTLNVTRADMIAAGYSPSVRLFEAAACGAAILSDAWPGLDTFFEPGREILVVRDTADVLSALQDLSDEQRTGLGSAARTRVLREHTAATRAAELEAHLIEALRHRSACGVPAVRSATCGTRPRTAGVITGRPAATAPVQPPRRTRAHQ